MEDNDYHQDMNKWERIKTMNEKKIRDLERQREQLQKVCWGREKTSTEVSFQVCSKV